MTDAALSSDGKLLAIRTYAEVLVFAVDPASGLPRHDIAPGSCRISWLREKLGEGIGWWWDRRRLVHDDDADRVPPLAAEREVRDVDVVPAEDRADLADMQFAVVPLFGGTAVAGRGVAGALVVVIQVHRHVGLEPEEERRHVHVRDAAEANHAGTRWKKVTGLPSRSSAANS